MIQFTIPAIPVAQPRQRHRILTTGGRTFAQNYTPTKHPVNAFKASAAHEAQLALQGPPLDGPVCLAVVFVMPRPKSMLWKRREMPRAPHTGRPDLDNLAKALKDALKGIAWRDDAQVYYLEASKLIAAGDEAPHVVVRIAEQQCAAEVVGSARASLKQPELWE